MTTQRDLLAAIAAAPDDDGVRLVYADWLEDHGQHDRAQLIRIQCRLACLSPRHRDRQALEDQERELLGRHQAAWDLECGTGVSVGQYHRGFPVLLVMSADLFVRDAGHL